MLLFLKFKHIKRKDLCEKIQKLTLLLLIGYSSVTL